MSRGEFGEAMDVAMRTVGYALASFSEARPHSAIALREALQRAHQRAIESAVGAATPDVTFMLGDQFTSLLAGVDDYLSDQHAQPPT